jgi:MOSC domain-containing protein YiiM
MAVDPSILTAVLSTTGTGTGVMVALIISGVLRTGQEVKRVEKDADDWKTAYESEKNARETERKANDELRATALVQSQRADAAVETAKLATALLNDLRKRTDAPAG